MALQSMAAALIITVSSASFAHAQDYSGPIIDAHAHLRLEGERGGAATHEVGTAPLLALDEQAGISRSALIIMARRGEPAETRRRNDATIAAARSNPDRFFPIASVHPLDGDDAVAELDRLASLNVKVIKLHPNSQNFDVADPAVARIADHAGKLGLILLFDSYKPWDSSELGKLLRLSGQYRDTRFVLAHSGFTQFREMLTFARLRFAGLGANVWFDLSAIATAYVDSPVEAELVWTMRQVGVERFLFGSDWPADTPTVAVDAIRRLGLDEDEQRLIFHDNAASLFGF